MHDQQQNMSDIENREPADDMNILSFISKDKLLRESK